MKRIILFSMLAGCVGRPVTADTDKTELELLCEDWCDTQGSCGYASDYSPEGECAANCSNSRGWDMAWEAGCEDETRAVLSCLGASTCEALEPMFNVSSTEPGPCITERGAVLVCSVSS